MRTVAGVGGTLLPVLSDRGLSDTRLTFLIGLLVTCSGRPIKNAKTLSNKAYSKVPPTIATVHINREFAWLLPRGTVATFQNSIGMFDIFFYICCHRGNAAFESRWCLLQLSAPPCLALSDQLTKVRWRQTKSDIMWPTSIGQTRRGGQL
jgi:hypothetical protein